MTPAQTIILNAQTELQDPDGVRWPATDLVRYLNEAQRAIVTKRPDQTAATLTFACVAGAEQVLPTSAMSLIDIPRNAVSKRALTKVSLPLLDASVRDWRSKTQVSDFVHFCHDLRRPRHFEVYPPAKDGAALVLQVSLYPIDVPAPSGPKASTVSGDLSLPDEWAEAVRNYVLYRAWSVDAEFGGNAALAQAHFQLFKADIGEQLQSAIVAAPTE